MKPFLAGLALGAVLTGLAFAAFNRPDPTLQRRADSLETVVQSFDVAQVERVRVDTVRSQRIVTLRAEAETLTVAIREQVTDTVRVLVDSLSATWRQALDTAEARVDFWRATADTLRVQRDAARALLRVAIRQARRCGIGGAVGYGITSSGAGPGLLVGVSCRY